MYFQLGRAQTHAGLHAWRNISFLATNVKLIIKGTKLWHHYSASLNALTIVVARAKLIQGSGSQINIFIKNVPRQAIESFQQNQQ